MSLRLKFGVLLALLGLAVMLTLGASWWAFSKLQSDVRDPLRSMSSVLSVLGQTKAEVERARLMVRPVDDSKKPPTIEPNEPQRFRSLLAEANLALEREDLAGEWRIRSGRSSLTNLHARIQTAQSAGAVYYAAFTNAQSAHPSHTLQSPDFDAILTLRNQVRDDVSKVHDLIESIEDHVVTDTRLTVDFSDDYRAILFRMLGSAFLIVLFTAVLGIVLVRRWILIPVAELRTAAAHIARGDFAYRIAVPAAPSADELLQLSAEVNHMAGMVKSMQDDRVERERLAALGEMVRRLAHNLRNPLAGIRGLAEITRTDLRHMGPESNELTENQSRIITAVDRFEKWLNELLGATRPMTIQPEPTEIARWLNGLVEAHRPMAQTRGVDLSLDTTDTPPTAVFDSRHLEHALSAMLSNAIESTSSPQARGKGLSGGTVRLAVHSNGHDSPDVNMGKMWAISITDEGTGITPDLRESIFRPYFTTKRDGNGIGLAVALSVVKAHGGQIVVESPWPPQEPGSSTLSVPPHWPVGARFTIFLPFERPYVANNGVPGLANDGQSGAVGGQDPRH